MDKQNYPVNHMVCVYTGVFIFRIPKYKLTYSIKSSMKFLKFTFMVVVMMISINFL